MSADSFYKTSDMAGPWLPTHIEGFDTLLRGGLLLPPCGNSPGQAPGLVVLIKGQPGTGKTTLAVQMARAATYWGFAKPEVCPILKADRQFVCIQVGPSEGGKNRYQQLTESTTERVNAEHPIVFSSEQTPEELYSLLCRLDSMVAFPTDASQVMSAPVIGKTEGETKKVIGNLRSVADKHSEYREDIDWLIRSIRRSDGVETHDAFPSCTVVMVSGPGENERRIEIRSQLAGSTAAGPITAAPSALDWFVRVGLQLEEILDTKKAPLIVVDGLNLLGADERHSFDIERLIEKLRRKALVSVIVYEDETGHHECVDYLADMIVQLTAEEYGGPSRYFLNRLCVTKSRYQQSVLGWHQYKICRQNGFMVFPSIHYHTHRFGKLAQRYENSGKPLTRVVTGGNGHKCPLEGKACFALYPCKPGGDQCSELEGCKGTRAPLLGCDSCDSNPRTRRIGELLDMSVPTSWEAEKGGRPGRYVPSVVEFLLGYDCEKPAGSTMKRGSCTIVLGPRRTCKTLLTLDFLRAGSKNGEAGTLLSLIDNESTILNQRKSLCEWFCLGGEHCRDGAGQRRYGDCYEDVSLFHLRPGCVTASELFHWLDRRLREGLGEQRMPFKRLVFWDLTQLEHRFPLIAEERLFVPALVDYLKHKWAITSVFMGAPNSALAQTVSAIADNVIFAWRDQLKDKPKDGKDDWGFAFFVDRKEGDPEKQAFHFLQESELTKSKTGGAHSLRPDSSLSKYTYAESMRTKIWAMQGFLVEKNER